MTTFPVPRLLAFEIDIIITHQILISKYYFKKLQDFHLKKTYVSQIFFQLQQIRAKIAD